MALKRGGLLIKDHFCHGVANVRSPKVEVLVSKEQKGLWIRAVHKHMMPRDISL